MNHPERRQPVAAAGEPKVVSVALAERSYDILIGSGLLERAGAEIAARLPGIRAAIVTDENVGAHYLERLKASLSASGIASTEIRLAAGEGTKSFEQLAHVVDAVLAARLERGDAVVALGGGVMGDLAGFAAGVVRRGMRFVQIPTTLLAQVDSSVGGKTGINTPHGKNLVGVFHQPALVLADTGLLDSLPRREFAAGYAEVVKYGLIDRPEFFAWVEANLDEVFAGGPARGEAIAESCRAKAEVVAADEHETGRRALLNLGHTFGHALEAATGYRSDRLVHGEGVAIGMALAHRFSVRQGLCPPEDCKRVEAHLARAGLPISLAAIPGERFSAGTLMRHIGQDKKVSRGRLTFILTRGIGRSFVASDVDPDAVEAFLENELSI